MTSSGGFAAIVNGTPFLWQPGGSIEAESNVKAAVERRLDLGGVVALSPTGPYVALDARDPVAVVAALLDLGADVELGLGAADLGLDVPKLAVP